MTAARKTPGRTTTAKVGAKPKGVERKPAPATRPPAKPAPSPVLAIPSPNYLIVGIGASAGGLEAMEEFFTHMPPNTGMGFVVVSHQHAGHVSLLPSLLSRCTAMPVVAAKDGNRGGGQLRLYGAWRHQSGDHAWHPTPHGS